MKETKQNKVLKDIYETARKMTIRELISNTGMTYMQVYAALIALKRRRLIKTTREDRKASRGVPPIGTLFVEINENVLDRIKNLIK